MKNDDEKLNNSINNRGYLVFVLVVLIIIYGMWKWTEAEKKAGNYPSPPTNSR